MTQPVTTLPVTPLLVRLSRETSYELPGIAAALACSVAKGETTYRAMWQQAFGENCTPKTEVEAKASFWFTAGMGAVRTLGLCQQELKPVAQRDADMQAAYQQVLDDANTILFDAREKLAVSGSRVLLRTLMESLTDVMGYGPAPAQTRKRLVVLARDGRRGIPHPAGG